MHGDRVGEDKRKENKRTFHSSNLTGFRGRSILQNARIKFSYIPWNWDTQYVQVNQKRGEKITEVQETKQKPAVD